MVKQILILYIIFIAGAQVCVGQGVLDDSGHDGGFYAQSNPLARGVVIESWDETSGQPALIFSDEFDFLESIDWEEPIWREQYPGGVSVFWRR